MLRKHYGLQNRQRGFDSLYSCFKIKNFMMLGPSIFALLKERPSYSDRVTIGSVA